MDPIFLTFIDNMEEFRPYVYYAKDVDVLSFHFKNSPDYRLYIGKHITLYLSMQTNEVVGAILSDLKGIMKVKNAKCDGELFHNLTYFEDGDFLTFFLNESECLAEQQNEFLTIFVDEKTNEFVGFKINYISKIMNENV